MSKRGQQEYLADMREAILGLQRFTSEITYDQFLADSKMQDAVIRKRVGAFSDAVGAFLASPAVSRFDSSPAHQHSLQLNQRLAVSQLPSPSLISNHDFGWVHGVV